MSATEELETLARGDPEAVRTLAKKAEEPIKGRLLRLLEEDGGTE